MAFFSIAQFAALRHALIDGQAAIIQLTGAEIDVEFVKNRTVSH